MSNDLSSKLTDSRYNQQSRGMSFVTNSDQRGSAAYVAQQDRERHAEGGAVGHDLLHLINPLHYTARKQGGMVSQSSIPRATKRDYQAELNKRIAYEKHLANQRQKKKTELAHFTSQEMAFLKANPGLVQDVTSRYKTIAKKGQGGDTKLGRVSKKTAKALDQLIHHGHEEVNPRTGLREYMVALCPLCGGEHSSRECAAEDKDISNYLKGSKGKRTRYYENVKSEIERQPPNSKLSDKLQSNFSDRYPSTSPSKDDKYNELSNIKKKQRGEEHQYKEQKYIKDTTPDFKSKPSETIGFKPTEEVGFKPTEDLNIPGITSYKNPELQHKGTEASNKEVSNADYIKSMIEYEKNKGNKK